MLKLRAQPFTLLSFFFLTSCALSQAQPDTPAVIVEPSAASRAELLAAVSDVLGVANVTLADDALTRSSTLIVEHTRPRDAGGRQLSGRDLDRPQHFQLMKSGSRCTLIHQESGRRMQLKQSACVPI